MRYWQSDNRTSTAVLPHLRATQKGNLARPHSRSPQAVQKPEGPAMHCHLHRGDWNFHLTNEKKKKKYSCWPPRARAARKSLMLSFSQTGRSQLWKVEPGMGCNAWHSHAQSFAAKTTMDLLTRQTDKHSRHYIWCTA